MIQPGNYRHHGGGMYTVLYEIMDSTNTRDGNVLVVYVSHAHGRLCARDRDEFLQPVCWPDGIERPRFRYAGDV